MICVTAVESKCASHNRKINDCTKKKKKKNRGMALSHRPCTNLKPFAKYTVYIRVRIAPPTWQPVIRGEKSAKRTVSRVNLFRSYGTFRWELIDNYFPQHTVRLRTHRPASTQCFSAANSSCPLGVCTRKGRPLCWGYPCSSCAFLSGNTPRVL